MDLAAIFNSLLQTSDDNHTPGYKPYSSILDLPIPLNYCSHITFSPHTTPQRNPTPQSQMYKIPLVSVYVVSSSPVFMVRQLRLLLILLRNFSFGCPLGCEKVTTSDAYFITFLLLSFSSSFNFCFCCLQCVLTP